MKNEVLQIGNITIQPGEKVTLALPTPELYSCAPMHVPLHVIHGKKRVLVCLFALLYMVMKQME